MNLKMRTKTKMKSNNSHHLRIGKNWLSRY